MNVRTVHNINEERGGSVVLIHDIPGPSKLLAQRQPLLINSRIKRGEVVRGQLLAEPHEVQDRMGGNSESLSRQMFVLVLDKR